MNSFVNCSIERIRKSQLEMTKKISFKLLEKKVMSRP